MQVSWGLLAQMQMLDLMVSGAYLAAIADRVEALVDDLEHHPDFGMALPGEVYLRQFFVERVRVVYTRTDDACEVVAVLRPGERLG